MTKSSKFRLWLAKLWQEHKNEVFDHTGQTVDYDLSAYVHRYRWWLKSIYQKENTDVGD